MENNKGERSGECRRGVGAARIAGEVGSEEEGKKSRIRKIMRSNCSKT